MTLFYDFNNVFVRHGHIIYRILSNTRTLSNNRTPLAKFTLFVSNSRTPPTSGCLQFIKLTKVTETRDV